MNDRDPFYSLYSPPRPLEKTPYQLDLEIKDRKPDIVPKVGDKVKIKSREWYEKWRDKDGEVTRLGTHVFFARNVGILRESLQGKERIQICVRFRRCPFRLDNEHVRRSLSARIIGRGEIRQNF